jgi:hypothetical protein
MTRQDPVEVCRQIARDQAGGLVGPGIEQSVAPRDPLVLIDSLDAYAEALRDLSGGGADQADEESRR